MIAETRNHKDDFLAGIKVEVSWKIRGSFGKFQDNFKPCNKVLLTNRKLFFRGRFFFHRCSCSAPTTINMCLFFKLQTG